MSLNIKENKAGFSLFELLVVIAIIGLMMGIVITKSADWFDLNIKKATNRLSATVRYLHDKASTENLYMRLVFDFEKNSYWVEATAERFMLASKEIEEQDKIEAEEEAELEKEMEAETELTEGEEGEEKKPMVKKFRTPEFSSIDDFLLKSVSLGEAVLIKDVYTRHDTGPVSSGQAFIYFFPNGYIEPAIINLQDEEDEINFSIKINPIMGTTEIRQEYRELTK